MSNVFFIGDTHFGHRKLLSLETSSRSKRFASIEEHDEHIVQKWNATVRSRDVVIHLGDVCFTGLEILSRLRGYKRLILGNHDKFVRFQPYFDTFHGAFLFKKSVICTHIPINPQQLEFRFKANIHGHIHDNVLADERYINVCCEHVDYTPIAWETLMERLKP